MELSKLQTQILNASSNKSVVIAAAAAGKTALLTEKVRQILRAGINPREVAVITFTNMAAAELKQRLGNDYKDGLFIGTIHALANYFLLSAGVSTDQILDDENFDKLFEMIEDNPQCIRHMDWILLDEAQDSDLLQFKFLFEMIEPEHFFVVGDPKQSIYQWRGGRPQLMLDLTRNIDVNTYDMNENYRNSSNILMFAKRLIHPTGLEDTSIPMRLNNGEVHEVLYNLQSIVSYITNAPNFKNWAVLARTNDEIATISSYLKNNGIPCDTFRQGDLKRSELITKLNQETVKVLTVHSAKGLEWDNVIVIGMRYTSKEERNVCYVAATRARDTLIWMKYPKKNKIYRW